MIRPGTVFISALLACVVTPATLQAQTFGIGPRLSFIRAHTPSSTPASRLMGGTIRLMGSSHTGYEISVDYRASHNELNTQRVRETPIQGSLLIFPVRRTFSPYLMGGVGVYSRLTDELGPTGAVLSTVTERKMGWHMGFGAELFLGRHAAFFADYRYRFVRFGAANADEDALNIPGTSFIPGLSNVKVSHQGSMWTSGIAFYF